MKKYVITYNEGIVTNKQIEIEAKNAEDALLIFLMEKPQAMYESIEEKRDDRSDVS